MHNQSSLFQCSLCDVATNYTYFGRTPPDSPLVTFLEDVFCIKDPFCDENREYLRCAFESHREYLCCRFALYWGYLCGM